jgi:hypothetical protein
MNLDDETGLVLAIHWVQQALITAYEDNCSLRPIKTGWCSLKWTAELESLRRGVRRHKSPTDQKLHRWECYREAQRRQRK